MTSGRLRTYADVMALTDRSIAEDQLLKECREGMQTVLGYSPPGKPTKANRVRAELLRYLILGGCPAYRPDERGVQLFGAYVTGTLDLSFCTTKGETDLRWCRFEEEIEAARSRIRQLDLSGSFLPGLNAQGVRVTGTLFLSDGFTAKGEMLLAGAKIGGQLACVGGQFENETGNALNARRLKVKGGLFWFRVSVPQGRVDLSSAEVGDLVDDLASWPDRSANGDERLVLDGF